ncbi:hypothetical protein IMZ48_40755 [Candidatus Bathyarchaeota archaeon]|nr:hypothetical protein [Candidatus Bathyarchaeota archaeon]
MGDVQYPHLDLVRVPVRQRTSTWLTHPSVEGSTIIIASSIPILQPLYQRLFGSAFDSRKYRTYGSGKNGQQGSVELSYQTRKRSVKDPNGLTFLDQSLAGSEESILPVREGGKHDTGDVQGSPQSLTPGSQEIMRTDVVTVSHSIESQQTIQDITYQGRGYAF